MLAPEPPTLFTTMSSPPNEAMAAPTTDVAPSSVDRSAATPRALPGPGAAATASSSVASPRAQNTTSAPSSTSRVAIARPMPRLEPVTSATFPASPSSTGLA